MSDPSDPNQNTTHTEGDVFPITLFARVVQGSEGTFIVTLEPPKPGEDMPGVAVRPIPLVDEGNDPSKRIGGALLREYSQFYADTTLRTAPTCYGVTLAPLHTTMYAVDGDGNPVPITVPLRASPQPDYSSEDDTNPDDITEDAGEE